jgi:Tfp pilus assembly protein PilX
MKSVPSFSRRGNALVVALLMSGILASMAAATTLILQKRFRQAHQTAAWEEAMLAAEAGVDLAINELRTQLDDPASAFQGWETQNPDGSFSSANGTGLVSGTTAYYTSTVFLRTSEGGQRSWCEVQIEAPTLLIEPNTKEQWYRVRSLGVAEIPGGGKVAGDKEDVQLRKLDLQYNRRTGQSVNGRPQATRMVEVLVKPVGTFRLALLAANEINMNNHNIVVDSYDSRDPSKSTLAFYDPLKRQNNGDIATNGILISAGSAHIYGDASTNGGTVLNSSNVTGEIRDDFF